MYNAIMNTANSYLLCLCVCVCVFVCTHVCVLSCATVMCAKGFGVARCGGAESLIQRESELQQESETQESYTQRDRGRNKTVPRHPMLAHFISGRAGPHKKQKGVQSWHIMTQKMQSMEHGAWSMEHGAWSNQIHAPSRRNKKRTERYIKENKNDPRKVHARTRNEHARIMHVI
jgi:hypothetical protein